MSPRILSFGADRTWVKPGTVVCATAELVASESTDTTVAFELLDLDRVVVSRTRDACLGPEISRVTVEMRLPHRTRHGYGLRVTVCARGSVVSTSSAVEALDGWWQSPRMAAITRYADAAATGRSVAGLVEWHVTVAQHYDWMWRHYRYVPPDGASVFTDALGRSVSHEAVRAGIDAGHEHGIAALAYGSVYGAEMEHIAAHPDDRVVDEKGRPLSLGGTFFITDLRPGSEWRQRLLAEYEKAIDDFGFDAIHMDSYGPPYVAVSSDGEVIDFAGLYPGLIDEAAHRVAARRADAKVTFNCVDGFPLEPIGPSRTACLYLELWASDGTFADVVSWIQRAHAVAAGRQVVIAAYAAALASAEDGDERAGAIEAMLLLGSIISASGAYHHVLAEDGRLLVEGYYPAAAVLSAGEADELKKLVRFGARYVHLLSDPDLEPGDAEGLRLLDADGASIATESTPKAGTIWLIARRGSDGTLMIHLVDLRSQAGDEWVEVRQPSRLARGLRLEWPGAIDPLAATPWRRGGDAVSLEFSGKSPDTWHLPVFERWLMVVATAATAAS